MTIFLNIAGAAALLIWSVRLVRTGVERAFTVQLRLWLRRSTKSRALAALTGTASAMLLQSATAVAIMVSGFVSSGTIFAATGLAILLGADVGSALVAQVLLVRQTWLVPLMLLMGVGLFLRGQHRRVRQSGRILIGLALIFVSLGMIREATAPLVDSTGAASVMVYLGNDMLLAFCIGALFTWLVHSSVAAVLLFVTLVSQGLMPQSAAVAMVLGANLGGALIAYFLTISANIEARRMIMANLVLRGGGAALVLVAVEFMDVPWTWIGSSEALQVINLHLVFNLGLALVALPVVGPMSRLLEKLMKQRIDPRSGVGPDSALDPATLSEPDRALSCANRETLHIGETVETMLRSVMSLYQQWDDAKADSIKLNDKLVRKMHFKLKMFLARLDHSGLDEDAKGRSMELSNVAVNLEAASDVIARNMVGLARRLDVEGVAFSSQGQLEISDLHDRILANVHLALNTLMTGNPDDARDLLAEKESIRDFEQKLQRLHLGRLREGLTESIETSNIHQETLRSLKQVNTAFSRVANPVFAESGDMLDSSFSDKKENVET
ncbi:MAG: Na/Pi cotransporter family protein [Granulosicoccus sp.]|nr:Na/Pi cotransporter family protein [Granulosicoccus sp.]